MTVARPSQMQEQLWQLLQMNPMLIEPFALYAIKHGISVPDATRHEFEFYSAAWRLFHANWRRIYGKPIEVSPIWMPPFYLSPTLYNVFIVPRSPKNLWTLVRCRHKKGLNEEYFLMINRYARLLGLRLDHDTFLSNIEYLVDPVKAISEAFDACRHPPLAARLFLERLVGPFRQVPPDTMYAMMRLFPGIERAEVIHRIINHNYTDILKYINHPCVIEFLCRAEPLYLKEIPTSINDANKQMLLAAHPRMQFVNPPAFWHHAGIDLRFGPPRFHPDDFYITVHYLLCLGAGYFVDAANSRPLRVISGLEHRMTIKIAELLMRRWFDADCTFVPHRYEQVLSHYREALFVLCFFVKKEITLLCNSTQFHKPPNLTPCEIVRRRQIQKSAAVPFAAYT